MWLEKDPSLCSSLTSELECFSSKLCKITAQAHCVIESLADHGLKPKLMSLLSMIPLPG